MTVNARLIDSSAAKVVYAVEDAEEGFISVIEIGDLIKSTFTDFENFLLGVEPKRLCWMYSGNLKDKVKKLKKLL